MVVIKKVFRLGKDESRGDTKFSFAMCGRKHLRDTCIFGIRYGMRSARDFDRTRPTIAKVSVTGHGRPKQERSERLCNVGRVVPVVRAEIDRRHSTRRELATRPICRLKEANDLIG